MVTYQLSELSLAAITKCVEIRYCFLEVEGPLSKCGRLLLLEQVKLVMPTCDIVTVMSCSWSCSELVSRAISSQDD